MNRFKKELIKKGIKLECSYEWFPTENLDFITVDAETASITTGYITLWLKTSYGRDMKIVEQEAL